MRVQGVVLTHKAVMSAVATQYDMISFYNIGKVGPGDAYLSYLPLGAPPDSRCAALHASCLGTAVCMHGQASVLLACTCARPPSAAAATAARERSLGAICLASQQLLLCCAAHIFDRVVEELMLAKGGCIGFYQVRMSLQLSRVQARLAVKAGPCCAPCFAVQASTASWCQVSDVQAADSSPASTSACKTAPCVVHTSSSWVLL